MTLYWVLFKEHLEMFLILLVTDKKNCGIYIIVNASKSILTSLHWFGYPWIQA